MTDKKIRQLTHTALILALTAVFQEMRMTPILGDSNPFSVFIIGSLVNASLLVTCEIAGGWYALIVAFVAPCIALLQGHLSNVILLPLVILGNVIFVECYNLFRDNIRRRIIGIFAGAILKWEFFSIAIPAAFSYFLGKQFIPELITKNFLSSIQVATALIGGMLSCVLVPVLRKVRNL